MNKKFNHNNKYYLPEKLIYQLDKISGHPLTIVEAPSGFGKTTAIRKYLEDYLSDDNPYYWYTCLGEPISMILKNICKLFSNIDINAEKELRDLNILHMNNLFDISSYLNNIQCQSDTYLVIDNYNLIDYEIAQELIRLFSMHENSNLHMIFIIQQIKSPSKISIYNNIHIIDASSLLFDRESIGFLFRMEGIYLKSEDLDKISTSTNGWIAAIQLQIFNLKEIGLFNIDERIDRLVESSIWNRLDPEEKNFMLCISIMDGFTPQQITIILNQDSIPEKIEELINTNIFIQRDSNRYFYKIHSILQDYLKKRFYHFQSKTFQDEALRKVGDSYAVISENYIAAEFYYKIKDYNAILSLPFTIECFDKKKGKYQSEFIANMVNECPDEIWYKYPFTMIIFGYYSLMNGDLSTFESLNNLISVTIKNRIGLNPDKLQRINGEYSLLSTLRDFNDTPRMIRGHEAALKYISNHSNIINPETPWLFATISVLNMFWRESGALEDTLKQIDIGSRLYSKLSHRHGIGYNIIMRAEAMLMRGKDEDAEILCHRALYEARSYRQTSMCICSELVLVQIYILRGDIDGYFRSINNLHLHAKEDSSLHILRMVEYSISVIGMILGISDYIAPWFYDMESIREVLYSPIIPFARILHSGILLMDKRYNEFYGICHLTLEEEGDSLNNIRYMIPELYTYILLSIAKLNNGKHMEAHEHLRDALYISLPDQIYLPFAQIPCMEDLLCELPLNFFNSSIHIQDETKNLNIMTALRALCRRQKNGVNIIKKSIMMKKSPLTPREREIAQLAKERLTSKEIADRLFISKTTVKTILRSVYSKLNIHSKTELASKDF